MREAEKQGKRDTGWGRAVCRVGQEERHGRGNAISKKQE
jgi:hypothetical protein